MKIYKYDLCRDCSVRMVPKSFRLLDVGIDNKDGELKAWGLISEIKQPEKQIKISIIGTGFSFDIKDVGDYVKTFQEGPLVWHVFYK